MILAWRKNALLLDENPICNRPEHELVVNRQCNDGGHHSIYRRHARVARFTPGDPMASDEVAAKAAEICSSVQLHGGTALLSKVAQGCV